MMTCAADCMDYEVNFNLLHQHSGPLQTISIAATYTTIIHNRILNTDSISGLFVVAKEERWRLKSRPTQIRTPMPALKLRFEVNRGRTPPPWKTFWDTETHKQVQNTLLNGTATDRKATWLNLRSTFSHHFREAYLRRLPKSQQGQLYTRGNEILMEKCFPPERTAIKMRALISTTRTTRHLSQRLDHHLKPSVWQERTLLQKTITVHRSPTYSQARSPRPRQRPQQH